MSFLHIGPDVGDGLARVRIAFRDDRNRQI